MLLPDDREIEKQLDIEKQLEKKHGYHFILSIIPKH